jgi:pimeloyl-ACP methyl ester carboxylesterase
MAQERMQLQVAGVGAPLVLVGGGLTGCRSWEPHAARLTPSRRVALAQPLAVQYGLEDRPLPRGYGVRTESAALAAALDTLDLSSPVDLAAWSYGALVTLDFALAQPERVRTLALIEPPALWVLNDDGSGDVGLRSLQALAREISDGVTETDLERFVRAVGLCPPDVAPRELPQWPVWVQHRRSLRSVAVPFEHRDNVARLRGFDRPVLLVTGTGTAPFLRRIVDELAARLPHAQTLELPAGHAPHLVSQERFLAELARFQAAAT